MNDGWVKLYRSLGDSDLWKLEPFSKGQAWVDLFLHANHKPGYFEIRRNIVELERGQLGWSELTMAKRWRWSRDKVRRFLSFLEKDEKIRQQKTRLTSIVTIINYDVYQESDATDDTANKTTGDTTDRQQTDNRQDTNKNEKKKRERVQFKPPEPWDVTEYFAELGAADGESTRFYDYYTANGWMVGRNKMKDWRAAARNWINRDQQRPDKNDHGNNQTGNDQCDGNFGARNLERLEGLFARTQAS